MTALTKARTVKSIPGLIFAYPVLANAVIYQGAIVVITSAGWAKPGVTGLGLTTVGVAREGVNNTGGSSGDVLVEVDERIVDMANSAGADEIAAGDVGKVCYLVDDQTVAKTDGGTAQVTRGDVVFNGTDPVGLTVDGYTVSVASVTSDDLTATALRDKWNADPVAKKLATATIDLSGAESYIILGFLDSAVHTVDPYSPATADVTGLTNTSGAVAATRSRAGYVRKLDGTRVYVEFTNKIASAA